jgi:alkaline phosphatase
LIVLGVVLVWATIVFLDLRIARESRHRRPLRQATVPLNQAAAPPLLEKERRHLAETQTESSRNLIVFIADGLGFAHLSAARAVLHGINGPATWDRFTATGWQYTHPANGFLTESAAAATALATGEPTTLEAIAVDAEGEVLETLFERAATLGYRTGIVTDSYVWDATPAAFVTHNSRRSDANAESALQQLGDSSLEVLAGELEKVGRGAIPSWEASIELLTRRFEVLGPEPSAKMLESFETSSGPTAAIFEEDQLGDLDSEPTLPELASAALRRLSSTDQPFLLLIESEEVDNASHKADFGRLLRGMQAIEATLETLLDFAIEDGETLLVFTSDHESGGLALSSPGNRNYELRPIWSTFDHTGAPVPVLAIGPGAEVFAGIHTNWEIGRLLRRSLQR